MQDINAAIEEMHSSPVVAFIRAAALHSKIFLCALLTGPSVSAAGRCSCF